MNYIDANTKGRERLRALVNRLTDEELALPVGDGWTIGAILAHLAFWDYRVLTLITRWKSAGVGPSPIDIDSVNDATKPLCRAIPGRKAANLAVEAAEAIDTELANLPEDKCACAGRQVPAKSVYSQKRALESDREHTCTIQKERQSLTP